MKSADVIATYKALSESHEMIEDALVIAKQGLLSNPAKEQRRALDEDILELQAKLAKIQGKMLALGKGQTGVMKPTAAQIAQISKLAAKVDSSITATATASSAMELTGKVLDLLSKAKFG